MKAIRKSDGKIIDVEVHGWNGDCAVSYHTNFKNFYKPEDLDFDIPQESEQSSSFDWQSFRAEASKDILCSMLTDQRISETMPYKDLVKMSLECTDELIKQLKEKKEK